MNARRFAEALVLLLINAVAWAQTTSLPLTDDTHIANDAGDWLQADRNYGSRPLMLVHDWGPFYALVRFDAAAISGQTVGSATLRLYLANLKLGGTISVHAITSPWTESSVTWNTGPSFEAAAETVIEVGNADVGSVVSVDITHLVAQWASGALQNHGVLLRTTEPIRAVFDTKETLGGIPADLEVTASTGPSVYAKVLDFTDPDGCIIDESGYYVLDRDWYRPAPGPDGNLLCNSFEEEGIIHIDAQWVKLDMRGFAIHKDALMCDLCPMVSIGGGAVTIMNGAIGGIVKTGTATVSLINITGQASIGKDSVIIGGRYYCSADEPALSVSANSLVSRVEFHCDTLYDEGPPALWVHGNDVEITGNRFQDGRSILLWESDSSLVANNVFLFSSATGIELNGNDCIIRGNVLLGDGSSSAISNSPGTAIDVTGHGNLIDGNIVQRLDSGIVFRELGNFFGNNRVSATNPFIGATDQTDWGGNVSF